eukprot:CAMPEP_0169413758 /NCGR_PEP_ID=MMETSP1017-20121227/61527_1 /TAXON_ID=342587 /ORGANISM="Karlodinium micrum, Strain CCMP2283" /LENGTH=293 /DNA_ID=CAMNT_0009521195 /DNA_START=45 /DNA_END=927 /DNA_ORIENTATION=-
MPAFKDVKHVQPVPTKDFDPFDGIAAKAPKLIPGKGDTDEEAKKVQNLTKQLAQAATGENSGICLAALDELRTAMVSGETDLDTQRRLAKLVDVVGGSAKSEDKDVACKTAEVATDEPDLEATTVEKDAPAVEKKDKGRTDKFTVKVNKELARNWGSQLARPMVNSLLFDCIVSVNGVTAPVDALKVKISSVVGECSFEVQPHSKFIVTVRRDSDDDKLGLDVANKAQHQTLLIRSVLPGLISRWNDASTGYKVLPGDRIVAINGSVGSGQFLRHQVSEAKGEISLSMVRISN